MGDFIFTEKLQERILTALWQDSNSYAIYRECIKPKFFTNSVHMDMCRIIFDYYEEYDSSPTIDVLIEEVNEMMVKSKIKQKLEDEYADVIARMSERTLEDLDYIKDKIISFGKKQAMTEAVLESADIIEKNGDYNKVEVLIKDAMKVGEDISNLGMSIYDDVEDRFIGYTKDDDVIERITTGNALLDVKMNGGLGKGEMGVCIASPGRGKTTWLINMGSAALLAGYNVVHYSFENNEKQIMRNYDLCVMEKDMEYFKANTQSSIKALLNIQKFKKGEVRVKKYPTKGATVNTIRAHLKQLEVVYGFKPDMIIVDYGSIMKPLNDYNDKRLAIESNYEDLRALADEYNCALWTAAQGNRGSLSKRVITIADLAEAFAIANVADFMIALCQTKKEKLKGIMRYFIAKQRDNEDNLTFLGSVMHSIKKMFIREEITAQDLLGDDDEEWEDD